MDIVQLLLDHGADPSLPEEQYAPRGKALYSAVMHGHYEIAKLLLERGAFPNPPVESSGDALWVSQEFRPDKRMEQLLLSYGVKPTEGHTGEDWPARALNWLRISPLHEAARKGDVPEAKKLLESGADLTARDEHLRSTPLAWAAKFGQLEMVKVLLRHGAPKALPEGGWHTIPRVYADGVLIAGDAGGFLNSLRLKGIHLAMRTGMLAAETAFDSVRANDSSAAALRKFEALIDGAFSLSHRVDLLENGADEECRRQDDENDEEKSTSQSSSPCCAWIRFEPCGSFLRACDANS
jgi:hypothetical protein